MLWSDRSTKAYFWRRRFFVFDVKKIGFDVLTQESKIAFNAAGQRKLMQIKGFDSTI